MNQNKPKSLKELLFLNSHDNELEGFLYSHLDWQKNEDNQIQYMFLSYVESCEKLYNSIKDGDDSDRIIFPLLFLIRHTLELGMKELTYFLKSTRIDSNNNFDKVFGKKGKGHDLSKLLDALRQEIQCFDNRHKTNIKQQLKNVSIGRDNTLHPIDNSNSPHINQYMYELCEGQTNDFFNFLEEFISVFHEIDNKSFSFRYPTDKQNKKSLSSVESINISLIYGIFIQLEPVLNVYDFNENFLSQ